MKVTYLLAIILAVIGLFGTTLVALADDEDEVVVVTTPPNGSVVIGESNLERDAHGVSGKIEVDLTPGDAITIWFRVSGGPVSLGAGLVVPDDGEVTAHIRVKKNANGLKNPETDVIGFIIRNHGPARDDAAGLNDQINTTPGGGCNPTCFTLAKWDHLAPTE